ncbi:hypothetical protein F4556_005882 [Kitasatospora gansuensis]|uniref:Uncharacterized protein n=2 Tax=Kitasatospora TaxID=2063 RepID=A0A7W7SHV4_9ACTN|nr:hypothetical protein [Kitasatospora gansuensis]
MAISYEDMFLLSELSRLHKLWNIDKQRRLRTRPIVLNDALTAKAAAFSHYLSGVPPEFW